MAATKIWVKKQLTLGPLTFKQQDMAALGFVGLHSVKRRIAAGRNTYDQASKPLSPGYARYKMRQHRQNRRDLYLSIPAKTEAAKHTRGQNKKGVPYRPGMLKNWTVRTVTDSRVTAGFTVQDQRAKAAHNQGIEPFVSYSPKTQQVVLNSATSIVGKRLQQIVKNG